MKTKVLAILAAVALVCAFTVNASAQTMLTDDVAFVKLGYSMFNGSFEDDDSYGEIEDVEGNGFNLQGEYNMNLGGIMLGFGLEYTYMPAEWYDEDYKFHFLSPMVTAKFITAGGFYLGAGLSGKYMMGQSYDGDDYDKVEFDEEIDLWAHGIIGFMTPVQEFVYIDIEARFGYNLTGKQFEKSDWDGTGFEVDSKSQYDIAFYVGVGYRVAATGF